MLLYVLEKDEIATPLALAMTRRLMLWYSSGYFFDKNESLFFAISFNRAKKESEKS